MPMRTQLDKLLEHIQLRLSTAGLTLSAEGKAHVYKMWNKDPSQGGYSQYWREL